MYRKRLKTQPVPQFHWLEEILKTQSQIIRSLVPGRRKAHAF
jgi:hypothetical protein